MLIEMLKSLLRKIVREFPARGRYRPERHYMRGPGPKSQARGAFDGGDNVKA